MLRYVFLVSFERTDEYQLERTIFTFIIFPKVAAVKMEIGNLRKYVVK